MLSPHQHQLAVEKVQLWMFWLAAIGLTIALGAIVGDLVWGAARFLPQHGWLASVASFDWNPLAGQFGMAAFIGGSTIVSLAALVLATPLGLALAIWAVQGLGRGGQARLMTVLTVFSAVPSVVFGWWGLSVVVPLLRSWTHGPGYSLAAAAVVLALMILPTFGVLAFQTLQAVPRDWIRASLALGASDDQTLTRIILRVSLPGMKKAAAIALARAMGETVAVQMVIGGLAGPIRGLWAPAATLTTELLTSLSLLPPGTADHGALDVMALMLFIGSLALVGWATWGGAA